MSSAAGCSGTASAPTCNFYGSQNEGLQVILFQDNVVIDLALVHGQVFFR